MIIKAGEIGTKGSRTGTSLAADARPRTDTVTEPNRVRSAFDPMEFRQALSAFATGVTVVTTVDAGGIPRGFTANSFTSVSVDPPLILVCIAKSAASYPVFLRTPIFAVSVLAEHQRSISSIFASKAPDKFLQVRWWREASGCPLINDAAAWFDCETQDLHEAGDHMILIGRVSEFGHSSTSPLGYCRGAYVSFGLSQSAVAAATRRTRVGAILEREGGVVLVEAGNGMLTLPTGVSLEPASDRFSLRGVLRELGLDGRLTFLFSVFEDARQRDGAVSIFYRGTLENDVPAHGRARLVSFADIPWHLLAWESRRMVRRFVKERSEDVFGIYVGDLEAGTIQPLAKEACRWTAAIDTQE